MKTPLKVPREEEDPAWCGFTRDIGVGFPLEAIRRDGYDVEECRDERGRFWIIVKKIMEDKA